MLNIEPDEQAMSAVLAKLAQDPRGRVWVIGQVTDRESIVPHPDDGMDGWIPKLQWRLAVGITDTHDCDQLEAMAARAQLEEPGQGDLFANATAEHDPDPDAHPDS
jgi:hypothetical protein